MDSTNSISAPHLASFLDFAQLLGFDSSVHELRLQEEGIDLCIFEHRVLIPCYLEILGIINEKLADPLLGLRYGTYLNLKALGLINKISMQAGSIQQALTLLRDYLEASFPLFELRWGIKREQVLLFLHPRVNLSSWQMRLLQDSLLCLMYRELRAMLGDTAELAVCLPHPNLTPYQQVLPIIKRQQTGIHFLASSLSTPLQKGGIFRLGELLPAYLQLIATPVVSFADKVRQMTLNLCSPELPAHELVIQQFALSKRSFQRKLQQEGTSFRQISDQIRRDLNSYLKQSTLGTKDIAFLLGYSSSAAYLHAVKRWEIN